MSEDRVATPRNRWLAASAGIVAAIVLVGFVVGFWWLPLAHPSERFSGVWDAICSAAGILHRPAASAQIVTANYATTRVEVIPHMLDSATAASVGRGGTLALRCTMCHGARGLSAANSPNLAGQYPIAIYKQLMDFKTGARASSVMAPLVRDLSDADMRDLAAYYAYLPRLSHGGAGAAPRIVAGGEPLRGIAPCGACHGEVGAKASAAWLEGQPVAYLRTQIRAFASGERHNDIDEQMRNVAREMTPQEIDAASRYYAEHP